MVTRHTRRGFTVIEVTIFLVISMLLLMSILGGLATRVQEQRYKDAVNDVADYLREVYSEVVYVENFRTGRLGDRSCTVADFLNNGNGFSTNDQNPNAHPGRSNCVVYGKLITFGEENSTVIHTYDVIGRTVDSFNAQFNVDDLKETQLAELNTVLAGAITVEKQNNSCYFTTAGNEASHRTEWESTLTYTGTPTGQLFKGAVLIVRSPISNIVHTYTLHKNNGDAADITIEIQNLLGNNSIATTSNGCAETSVRSYYNTPSASASQFLSNFMVGNINDYAFTQEELNFCVESDDLFASRRNIRFEADGHDYTAVTLVPADGGDNLCR